MPAPNEQALKAMIDSITANIDSLTNAKVLDHISKVNADYSHNFSLFPTGFWPNATLISIAGCMIPITAIIGVVILIYLFFKYRHRERLEMIKMGMNPSVERLSPVRGTKALFAGLVFLFLGLGILISSLIHGHLPNEAISFNCIGIGAACLLYWKLIKKEKTTLNKPDQINNGTENQADSFENNNDKDDI